MARGPLYVWLVGEWTKLSYDLQTLKYLNSMSATMPRREADHIPPSSSEVKNA